MGIFQLIVFALAFWVFGDGYALFWDRWGIPWAVCPFELLFVLYTSKKIWGGFAAPIF